MDILLNILFFFAGFLLATLWVINILSALFFAIPFTLKLIRDKALVSLAPLYTQLFMISLSLLFLSASIVFVTYIFPSYKVAYIIGLSLPVLLNIGQYGRTTRNLVDYLNKNSRYMNKETTVTLLKSIPE